MKPTVPFVILLAALAGCDDQGSFEESSDEPRLIQEEREHEAQFLSTPIAVSGSVVANGTAVVGATVSLQGQEVRTGQRGEFRFDEVDRRTSLIRVGADLHHVEQRVVWLHRPLSMREIEIDPIRAALADADEARMLFGGDVSLGRRFLNSNPPTDRVPDYDPESLISVDSPDETTRAVLEELRPLLREADFVSVNLETVVTDEPTTPFDQKPFIFFTLPGSLDALEWWGVDYVALGNNHIYDYLEKGVVDTIRHLDARGMAHSGAGRSPQEAFEAHRVEVAGSPYSLVSVISFDGRQYPILWTADETKSGAAYAWDSERFAATLQAERDAGRTAIVNLHTGSEYTELPSESALDRMYFAAEEGASMVIAHHPHVAQGFEWYQGRLIAHSLGNLAFDQERLETVMGLLAQVDVQGDRIVRVVGVPVYLENFKPRPVGGEIADVFLRRIAWASAQFGAHAAVDQGLLWLMPPDTPAATLDEESFVSVDIGDNGVGLLDLRPLADSSRAVVSIDADGLSGTLGRDILVFGDMEDLDVDKDSHESSAWYTTGGSSFPCLRETHRGAVALCSHREAGASSTSVVNFRNRIRTLGNPTDTPNKNLTFLAWLQGDNAGRAVIDVGYFAPMGPREFGQERAVDTVVGSRDWEPFWFDLATPPDDPDNPESRTLNPRALRVFIEHHAPEDGEGLLRIDDAAVVTWLPETRFDDEWATDVPHPRDFVRFEGPPGTHDVKLTFRKWLPE